jgi:SRSO17 transposase
MSDRAMARIAGRFGRFEPRATVRAHPLGLLPSVERKNCRQPADQAGSVRPGPMQRLLRHVRWDAEAVRDDLSAYAADHLGTADAALITDETGFVKKGHSGGRATAVHRSAGRIEHSRTGVFLALATGRAGP